MTVYFNSNDFDILKFYSYPCSVVDRLIEYSEDGVHGNTGERQVKKFFEDCLKETENKSGRKHLMDNKIAMKIYHKPSKTTLYVGYKDNIWSIGLSMHPYMKSTYTLEL